MSRGFVGILILLLATPGIPIRAQESDTSVFRATTRLVQLNVLVLDKQRHTVSGLSPEDFVVIDNGREQKLIHFSMSSSAAVTPQQDESPLVITNRSQQPESSMTVILIDELVDQDVSLTVKRQALQSARLQVMQFVSALQPGDQVALYALRPEGVVVLHDFSDDPAALRTAAKSFGVGLLRPKSASKIGELSDAKAVRAWIGGSMRNPTVDELMRRQLVTDAFQSIARHLQGIRGRKNLVWISADFPSIVSDFNPGLMFNERDTATPVPGAHAPLPVPQYASPEVEYDNMRDLARSLSRKNVSVYPMDASGLMGIPGAVIPGIDAHGRPGQIGPSMPQPYISGVPSAGTLNGANVSGPHVGDGGQAGLNSGGALPPTGPITLPYLGQWSVMDLIASETGGRAFYNTNGLAEHIREVVDQSHVAYTLGYYPGDSAWDGKYHKIELKLKRSGLVALCRKGYYAIDENIGDSDNVLHDLARSPLDASRIGVTLNVSSNPLVSGAQDVVVKIDAQDIDFTETQGRWKAQLDIVFANIAKDGRVLGGDQDHVELALYPNTYSDVQVAGWLHPKNIFIDWQTEKLRVVVRDLATGASGSVSVPVLREKRR